MKRHYMFFLRPVALILGLAVAGLAQADAITDQAKALLTAGKPAAAFELLLPFESQRAGEVEFDLLLGIAALDAGHNTSAVFALERVLAVDPNNSRARAEIARAYLALGETQTAKQQFETVKGQPVPEEVKRTIDKFLSAIERSEDEGRTTVKGYAEFTYGRDSNVNSTVSGKDVAIPAFGGALITLAAAGVKQSDDFTTYAGGANLRMPLSNGLALVGGMSASKRMNGQWDIFDTGSWDGNLGLALARDKDVFSLSAQVGTFYVDDKRYRDAWGLSGQWQHNYDQRTQATAFLQYSDLAYPLPAQNYAGKKRDATRWVGGLGFAHALSDFRTVFYGSVYVGYEQPRASQIDEIGYRINGVRGGGQYKFSDDWSAFANVSYEHRGYRGIDLFFLQKRHDGAWNAGFGAVYVPAKDWKITPQYQYTRNDSNVATSDYKREVLSITVRRDF
ncbi:MAG: DUF560 domain-containing protein [Rhodocyclaceae bacterium]|nr:DUF560 domain-containing protein [Rhodocyclaceae bacterium]